jgi:hypothetical protein
MPGVPGGGDTGGGTGGGTACEKHSMTPLDSVWQQSPGSPEGTCQPRGHGSHTGVVGAVGSVHDDDAGVAQLQSGPLVDPSALTRMAGQPQTGCGIVGQSSTGYAHTVVPLELVEQHPTEVVFVTGVPSPVAAADTAEIVGGNQPSGHA